MQFLRGLLFIAPSEPLTPRFYARVATPASRFSVRRLLGANPRLRSAGGRAWNQLAFFFSKISIDIVWGSESGTAWTEF